MRLDKVAATVDVLSYLIRHSCSDRRASDDDVDEGLVFLLPLAGSR
jgi:hypothetical protein